MQSAGPNGPMSQMDQWLSVIVSLWAHCVCSGHNSSLTAYTGGMVRQCRASLESILNLQGKVSNWNEYRANLYNDIRQIESSPDFICRCDELFADAYHARLQISSHLAPVQSSCPLPCCQGILRQSFPASILSVTYFYSSPLGHLNEHKLQRAQRWLRHTCPLSSLLEAG